MFDLLDYVLFFGLIGFSIVVGFLAVFWKRASSLENQIEYGLAGRKFGTVIVWFLIGGDIYTAYTLIAVPGLEASSGGIAMFAIPYVVLVYPLVYIFMPKLWNVSKKNGYVTAGDYVKDRFSSRSLAALIGITGVVAEMPYIALQMVGIEVLLSSMKIPIVLSLTIAFLFVAGFTLVSGLRGPALTAIVKDVLIWAAILVIIVIVPLKLGGFGTIFSNATTDGLNITISPSLEIGYVSLALGSAFALFLYPHAFTGAISSRDSKTIKQNSSLLPLYSILLLFVTLLGIAAVVVMGLPYSSANSSYAFPDLIIAEFPPWFSSFAFAAVVIGSMVPSSIMALASANLITRNVYLEYINPKASSARQSNVSRIMVLVVIVGALLFSFVPAASAQILFLQTFGGAFVLQTLPAVFLSLYTRKMNKYAIGLGWFVSLIVTVIMLIQMNFTVSFYKYFFGMYVGILGLLINLGVVGLVTLVFYLTKKVKDEGTIDNNDFNEVATK
jgi:SSS family solute:Na+ symporter